MLQTRCTMWQYGEKVPSSPISPFPATHCCQLLQCNNGYFSWSSAFWGDVESSEYQFQNLQSPTLKREGKKTGKTKIYVPQKPSRRNPINKIYEQLKKDLQASPCSFKLYKVLTEAFQAQLRSPEPGRLTARVFMTLWLRNKGLHLMTALFSNRIMFYFHVT